MRTIFEKNAEYPNSVTRTFTTAVDNQTSMLIKVFEGEKESTKHNKLIGTFLHEGIEPQ